MKKNRFFSMLLSFVMCFLLFGMVACGSGETPANSTKPNGDDSTSSVVQPDDGEDGGTVSNVTVTFMANGSEYASVEIKEGAQFPENPTKDGETFLGWYVDDGVWSNKLTDLATVTQSITVYARFGQAVTLTYYINNNEYYTDVIDGQSAVTLPAAPAIDGFEFKGWYFKNYSGMLTSQLTEDYFVNNNTAQNKSVYAKISMITKDNSASGAYTISGNYLYMGRYPTSIMPKNTSLKSTTPNAQGYYEDYSGNLYVKVDSCTHNNQTLYPEIGQFFQDNDTIIENGKTYYFKVETIKWRILESDEDTALVMPTQVLFKSQYKATADEGIDIRDYTNSDIRKYMNETLIKEIFTEAERSVILTSWVDNSKDKLCPTGYKTSWKDTYDKLYLLDLAYIKSATQSYLQLPVSDYMRATGMPMYTTELHGGDYGYTYSWARGIAGSTPKGVTAIGVKGGASSLNADVEAYGVVPVFRVDL